MAAARILALHMSTEDESESKAVSTDTKISADGTFYDDEVSPCSQFNAWEIILLKRLLSFFVLPYFAWLGAD